MIVQPAADTATDVELITQSHADPERFAGIFDRHAPRLHRYLARRVGPLLADDLTAETFLVAFRQRGRYDAGQADARGWLFGIATNLARRERRSEARQYRALARTGIDLVASLGEDEALDRVAASTTVRRLAAVLARMPDRERSVLLLIAWEQFTYEEVARALDIPVGTVRSRLHHARKRIRAALADLEPDQNGEKS